MVEADAGRAVKHVNAAAIKCIGGIMGASPTEYVDLPTGVACHNQGRSQHSTRLPLGERALVNFSKSWNPQGMKLALSIYRIVLVSLLVAWPIVEPSLATMVYLVYGVMLFFAWIAYYDG
jgi:hypothetical protein